MLFFNTPALPPQELNKPLPAISVEMHSDPSPVTSSKKFRDGVQAAVIHARRAPNKYIFIEGDGAAWRGETHTVKAPIRFNFEIPEVIPKGATRYLYIGLEQAIKGHRGSTDVRSDIGMAYDPKVGAAVPFVTSKDPSLNLKKAQIVVWDVKKTGIDISKGQFTNFRNKYYTVTPDSSLFPGASFAPGEKVSLTLQPLANSESQSLLVLTMKSDNKTVIVRIPRSNTLLSRDEGIRVHKVTSTTIEEAHRHKMTPGDLLICSAQGLSKSELMSFPALGNLYLKSQLAMNK